jgi:hypothetical protein
MRLEFSAPLSRKILDFSIQASRKSGADIPERIVRKAAGATYADDRPREGAVAFEELLDGAAHRGQPRAGLRRTGRKVLWLRHPRLLALLDDARGLPAPEAAVLGG